MDIRYRAPSLGLATIAAPAMVVAAGCGGSSGSGISGGSSGSGVGKGKRLFIQEADIGQGGRGGGGGKGGLT